MVTPVWMLLLALESMVCAGQAPWDPGASGFPAPPLATRIDYTPNHERRLPVDEIQEWGRETATAKPHEVPRAHQVADDAWVALEGEEPGDESTDQSADQSTGESTDDRWSTQEFFGFFEPQAKDPARIVRLGHSVRGGCTHWQWDTAFAGGRLFTSQAERSGNGEARLVWRELAKGQGRPHTLVIDRKSNSLAFHRTRYGLGSETHSLQPAPADSPGGGLFPMQWLGVCRTGDPESAPPRIFNPQTARWETARSMTLSRVPVSLATLHPQQEPLRYVRLIWLESQTTSEWLLSGTDLVSFRLHARGPWAARLQPEAWYRWHDDWHGLADFVDRGPKARAMEAAAPFLDKRARVRPLWWRNDGKPLDSSLLPRKRL